ncbi:YdcF family protein [Nodosilinea sp. E11]|uniref:YdcF family protein n=1 Tax=Nodosilinea sp. E11 TaxID=3037479 RepID=UPI002934471A|nr:YdcF family protein [Nodosilinea sp. E11]WOD39471.1 YdcF family protein [Nodosilinea sp. E11]
MVDLSACQATVASHWAGFSWRLYSLLVQPHLVMPVLAILIAAPWAFRSWRWKRQASLVGVGLLLLYGLGLSPLGGQAGAAGLTLLIPPDNGQPADAIVVLGRGGELRASRAQVAADLWRQQRAPLVFASGRGDAIEIGQMLATAGLPAPAIDGEPCSATTNENALFTAAQLQPQGVKRLILVTDPPHMARSLLTFRSLGFEVTPHPSPLPKHVNSQQQHFIVVREWVGLISYGMMGRYFSRSVEAQTPRAQAIEAGAAQRATGT